MGFLLLNQFKGLTAHPVYNTLQSLQDPNAAAIAAMAATGYDYYPPATPPAAAVAMTQLTHAPHHNLPIMAATQQPAAAVPVFDPHLQQQQG